MTSEADDPIVATPSGSIAVALQSDRLRALRRARRHSRLVRVLRAALPICAVLVIGLYFVSSKISVSVGGVEASIGRIEVSREKLRMVNPKIEGVTKDKGTYAMTADYAEQDVSKPDTLYLHKVRTEMLKPKDEWSRMTAPKGTFHTKSEQLSLYGGIKVVTSSGMTAHLSTADIDMNTQIIRSNDPVRVEFLNGTIRSQTIEIAADDRRVFFRGQVRVHMKKRPDAKK